MTGSELADLLGLPVHHIRQMTTPADLDDLPVRTIRALADRLTMTWPDWLEPTTGPGWSQRYAAHPPPEPDPSLDTAAHTTSDTGRVHAVLALALGRTLRLDQTAHILNLPTERVHRAVDPLAALTDGHHGLRLIVHDNQALQLTISPRTLDHDARERLLKLMYQRQGPTPGIALVAYRIAYRSHHEVLDLLRTAPDLLASAVSAGYVTYQTADDGRPSQIQLTPDVAFSLDIATSLHDSFLPESQSTEHEERH